MTFPTEKELKLIRDKLSKVEPSRLLPKNASKVDYIKYKLCENFIDYLYDHKMSQVQLAKKIKVDPSRINEIVKYRIDLFTVDKLIDLTEQLNIDFIVEVRIVPSPVDYRDIMKTAERSVKKELKVSDQTRSVKKSRSKK